MYVHIYIYVDRRYIYIHYIYIYIYIYMHACNLMLWAGLGFQDVMKQQEIRRNTETKRRRN